MTAHAPAATDRRWWQRSLRSWAGWALTLGVIVALVLISDHHAHTILETLREASPWPIFGAAALHGVTLVLRSEAWRIGLRAVGAERLPAGAVHRANALAFLVGTIQGELSLPARVAALRRAEPQRAPTAVQTAMVDAPLALVEVALLCAVAAFWEPWLLLGTVAIALTLPALARHLAPRRPAGSALRGLMVAADPRTLLRLALVMACVVGFSALRIWLILLAFELPLDIASVAKIVAAVTLIGVLPVGLGTGPAAAIASLSTGAAAVTTDSVAYVAGLAISATSVLGVIAYSSVMGALVLRERLRRGGAPAPAEGDEHPAPASP